MNCKYCTQYYEAGYGSFCSRSCCNKARGPRSQVVRGKIKHKNIQRASERGEDFYKKLKEANSSPEKLLRVKNTWLSKRDYNSAHLLTVTKWLKEEIRECQNCGLGQWCGSQLPLKVHHIDGDKRNNTKENLQVLCPNCHSLTKNWRGRK